MKPRSVPVLAVVVLLAGACATRPSEPSVIALPGSNKTLDQFMVDDASCRQFAWGQGGDTGSHLSQGPGVAPGVSPGAATAARPDAYSAFPGDSADRAQFRYDAAYVQCMYAKGQRVPVYGQPRGAPPTSPPADYKPVVAPPKVDAP
ncbi:glycine zipper family protein [Cupriavidus pauculus]|uniref:Glycine zipper family protein n=1 Tax=Cupriavidus pauculus TaxID=82633 RepID=A0A2N5C238_9BURK|nr:glycine zipper family protein [Cupriavidus pauculus]